MPWYAAKPVSGIWGFHWTMDSLDPDKVVDGKHQIASHDYPMIGPYDSSDPHVLEYHVLLMKLAGIDGVIIDGYGTADFYDYRQLHINTGHLIQYLRKAGLKYTICYEDQSVKHMVAGGKLDHREAAAHARKQLLWLDSQWFDDDNYVRVDDRPLLLVFGPQYFNRNQWKRVRRGLAHNPLLIGLPHLVESHALDGAFVWPPVQGGKTIAPADWTGRLRHLYAASADTIAVAFPGFHDYYKEAGKHDSYGFIDSRNGATLRETLRLSADRPILQIATWNDFGEGTVVEPTLNDGFKRLETVQKHCLDDNADPAALRLPIALHKLRKAKGNIANATADLDKVAAALRDGRVKDAKIILAQYQ
jgi:hypothetical protein